MGQEEPEIRLLPEVIQNKIAAGEVVERPASVVKELVENALDAGATRIAVEIEEGGLRLIRVSDDGSGMNERNLALCIERHATSKIRDVDDIFRIRTMGFRGEALPSIGAVSRLTISTAQTGRENGHQLRVTGGSKEPVAPAAPRPGTVVEARDLFFNTPARRKFMKSISAEVAAINETITRIALANPGVAFRVESGGKPQLDLPPHPDLSARIRALFGKALNLLPVERISGEAGELTVRGFIARPPESRANSRFIYTFLNNRWIRHPGLTRGICDAYQGSLPPRRYPFAVLLLDIDPAQVDVNAHPTKEIVRFENEGLIIGAAHKAVREALRGASFLNEVERARQGSRPLGDDLRADAAEAAAAYIRTHSAPAPACTVRAPAAPASSGSPAASAGSNASQPSQNTRPLLDPFRLLTPGGRVSPFAQDAALGRGFQAPADSASRPVFSGTPTAAFGQDSTHPAQAPHDKGDAPERSRQPASASQTVSDASSECLAQQSEPPTMELHEPPARHIQQELLTGAALLRLVGQAGGRYLVIERPDGLLLVDQHAMHERWNYDRLREKDRPLVSQRMLLPVRIELTPAEKGLTQEALPLLEEAGFDLELQEEGDGAQALLVTAHPEIVPAGRIEQTVRDVLADLEHAPLERFRDELLASLACHSAVLFGTRLSPEACLALLEKYKDGGLPTCPHGRPTGIFFPWSDLAGRFGR